MRSPDIINVFRAAAVVAVLGGGAKVISDYQESTSPSSLRGPDI